MNANQGKERKVRNPAKIDADTEYAVSDGRTNDRVLHALNTDENLDLIEFMESFENSYCSPYRKFALGCYRMIRGIIGLLFVGLTGSDISFNGVSEIINPAERMYFPKI